jgi:hypothetical protein
MPIDADGRPRTRAWEAYADACRASRPPELRNELWLEAHMQDLHAVRASGVEAALADEAARHPEDPTWRLLQRHVDVTLGTRLFDASALAGRVAYETAFASSLGLTVRRLVTTGARLLGRYGFEAARALLAPWPEPVRPVVSYRRAAVELIRGALGAAAALRVYRRGVRGRDRGAHARQDEWRLLDEILGDRLGEVHPLIAAFYTNPSRFSCRASLDLHTVPARFWSWLLTFLLGQGLYESGLREANTRLRVFRRADGSMHFLREIESGGNLRVFDSDFVVRAVDGQRALFEVFVDYGIDLQLEVTPLPGGGLSIHSRRAYLRGLPLPFFGLHVDFVSRVPPQENEHARLLVDGHLFLRPRSAAGRFFAHRILRRPEQLAVIHYDLCVSGAS